MAKTSFLPEDYVERKTQRRTNVISLTLFVVVMTGIIGAFLVTDRQRAEIYAHQQQVNSEFQEAAKRLEQLDHLQKRKEQMLRKARVTAVLIERVPRSLILAELINRMPTTLSLLELELKTKAVRTPPSAATQLQKVKQDSRRIAQNKKDASGEVEIPDSLATLRLVGVAPTDVQVAQFMTALSRSPMFKDVNLAFSEEVNLGEDQLMRKFRIDLTLNQDLNIQDIEPTMVQRRPNKNPMSNTVQIDAAGKLVIPTNKSAVVKVSDGPTLPQTKD